MGEELGGGCACAPSATKIEIYKNGTNGKFDEKHGWIVGSL